MFSQKWDEICNDGEDEFNELLEKEGVTLQDLLDNDNCIEQLENSNAQLLKLSLDEPKNFAPLIEYVTVMPQGGDEKRAFRYPYYACQILKDPQSFIFKKLLEQGYLSQIMAVLTNPINEVLAGYLFQILEKLAAHKIKEFLEFFQAQTEYLEFMFKLSHLHSISLCLSLFLKIDPDVYLDTERLSQLRQQILSRILLEMQTNPARENFRDILIQLCDVRENYEGEILLEFLINESNFLKIAKNDYGLSLRVLGALFPQTAFKTGDCSDKHVSLKSLNKRLMKINSLDFQKVLIGTLKEYLQIYIQKKTPKLRVDDLDFFIMMQRLSYANSEMVSDFFSHHELWLDLIKCIVNYPTTNMMHIEVVKIIRNGVRHKLALIPQPSGGVKNIVTLLTQEFEKERSQTVLYFGYLLQVAFQLRVYAVESVDDRGRKTSQIIELWEGFESKYLQPEFDRGNTPIDDQRVIDVCHSQNQVLIAPECPRLSNYDQQ